MDDTVAAYLSLGIKWNRQYSTYVAEPQIVYSPTRHSDTPSSYERRRAD
jgi:hypothetical protein